MDKNDFLGIRDRGEIVANAFSDEEKQSILVVLASIFLSQLSMSDEALQQIGEDTVIGRSVLDEVRRQFAVWVRDERWKEIKKQGR